MAATIGAVGCTWTSDAPKWISEYATARAARDTTIGTPAARNDPKASSSTPSARTTPTPSLGPALGWLRIMEAMPP